MGGGKIIFEIVFFFQKKLIFVFFFKLVVNWAFISSKYTFQVLLGSLYLGCQKKTVKFQKREN